MRLSAVLSVVAFSVSSIAFAQAPLDHNRKLERLQTALRKHQLTLTDEFLKIGISEDQIRQLVREYTDDRGGPITPPTAVPPALAEIAKVSYPSGLERLLRSTTITAEAIQQPKTAFLYDPSSAKNLPVPNPDGMLWKVSSTTDYSQLVPATADILSQATVLKGAGADLADSRMHAFCSAFMPNTINETRTPGELRALRTRFVRCVLRSAPKYTAGRVASGFKGTFSYSQNPSIVSGAPVVLGDVLGRNAFSGEADFDPTKLFVTGTDWLNGYQTAALYGTDKESDFANFVASQCGVQDFGDRSGILTRHCVDRLAGPHGWSRIAALVIPTVKYIEKTNFDYTVATGSLTPNNYPSRKLADLTFSLDLTKWLPAAKSRQDAVSTITKIMANKPVPTQVDKLFLYWTMNPEAFDADNSLYMNLMLAINDMN